MKEKKQQTDKRPEIVSKCIEILSNATPETYETDLKTVINTLSDYPKPTPKGAGSEAPPAPPAVLSAYLYMSNARNYIRLGLLKQYTPHHTIKAGKDCLECAKELINESIKKYEF